MTRWLPISEKMRERTQALETWQPTTWQPEPVYEEPRLMRQPGRLFAPPTEYEPTPQITPLEEVEAEVVEERVSLPFWQRALEVFAAPFVWVDENIIKPTLALAGTAIGLVPEEKRKAGEDFWEWKKRSWEGWEAPGFKVNVPWSDEPWTIDFKGVAELAPWLLIPGAGQVGVGARAARGIAGIAGKLGPLGKAVGYAVEYSPWGLVEKTAGRVLKAGARGVGRVTAGVSERVGERLFGKIPEPKVLPVVQKLTKTFEETVMPGFKVWEEKGLPALRAKQAAALEKVAGRYRRGEITSLQRTELRDQALKVLEEETKAGYRIKPLKFTNKETKELLDQIYSVVEKNFDAEDSARALRDLLMIGEIPQPHHIKAFAQIYGEGFAKAVGQFSRLPVTTRDKVLDLLNMPRAVLASGDLSATFRQGLILLLTHPEKAPAAFWKQLKAFASEKISLEMDDALRTHPLYKNAVADGVEFTALRRGARMAAKEEPFFSNIAQRVPMVRRSERAFTTFLNQMRMGTYESAYGAMTAQGATTAEMKLMASFVNKASGRGTLPKNLDRYAPALNTLLFSARYQMSTLQMPRQIGRMLISKNPYMRKEGAKALVTFVGGGVALLTLLNNLDGVDIEWDPRSSDFGKIKIGETRLDIWRGYVQYARFAAQFLTEERKSAYGNMNKDTRFNIAQRFLQSKLSPAAGLIADLWKGENYMGEPLFNETTGFIKMARDRFLPLALQDTIDAMEQGGINNFWVAAPATLGVGVLTYVNDFVKTKEKIAKQMGYDTWDEIDPKTQRHIQNTSTELQRAYLEFDRQVMGTAWGDWRLAGNAVEEVFTEDVDMAVAQYRETGDGYTFREKISDAYEARRGGYAAREKEPRFEDVVKRLNIEDMAEAILALGPEQLAIKTYNDAMYGDDMYDEFGDYRFDEADKRKEHLIKQLGKEMFDYVEEYRGLKYETFPYEFQELVKAKKILRPYWKIREDVEAIFGIPKTPTAQRRVDSIISRMRKRLRRINPQVAYYYDLFYKRSTP